MILAPIPKDRYSEYRYEIIFGGYKWDPQVGDVNTVENHVLLLSPGTVEQLDGFAELLTAEVFKLEDALCKNPELSKELCLPRKVRNALKFLKSYERERHVRLMRFDFHPTDAGWAVSEVNSDVPGGFSESSVWQQIAAKFFDGCSPCKNPAEALAAAFKSKVKPGGTIAFVHATSYSDDRQIMEYLSLVFKENGFQTLFLAPDHIQWVDRKAVCTLSGANGTDIDGIARYFPLEWLASLKKGVRDGFYSAETVSGNPGAAIFAQSKRLPLVWDKLGLDVPTWKKLLPETVDPRRVKDKSGYILKPALGRVGAYVAIKEAMSAKDFRKIERDAKRHPKDWVAQKRFNSAPLMTEGGEARHICVGVYTVDGKAAGLYGRTSPYPRIDMFSKDIPILVNDN
ncbi:MAG: glutathionylspermidine synthase family protein [Firmicutes bacterium]|nr:glutathionylspermidine synthase family protein [Bacillota bacterium]